MQGSRYRRKAPAHERIAHQLQRLINAHARLQQQRQIARKRRDVIVLDAAREQLRHCPFAREQGRKSARAIAAAARLDRNQAEIFDALDDFRFVRRVDIASDDLAARGQGPIAEFRHGLTGST
jgi:hypothetical protein